MTTAHDDENDGRILYVIETFDADENLWFIGDIADDVYLDKEEAEEEIADIREDPDNPSEVRLVEYIPRFTTQVTQ